MTRLTFRRIAFGAIIAPLTLGLAACGEKVDSTASLSGEPIERIAPPQGKIWTEVVSKTDAGGYRMGNPDAPIKLVEYGSLTCPHCANFAETSGEELHEEFVKSGRVSFEFRNFVTNPLDLTMAMLTRCGTPESFFALTEQTFANQPAIVETWSSASEAQLNQTAALPPESRFQAIADLAGLPEFFAARGIAADQAKACLADNATAEALAKATSDQGNEFGITGTPSFLINGQKVDMNSWPEIKTELETLGAR